MTVPSCFNRLFPRATGPRFCSFQAVVRGSRGGNRSPKGVRRLAGKCAARTVDSTIAESSPSRFRVGESSTTSRRRRGMHCRRHLKEGVPCRRSGLRTSQCKRNDCFQTIGVAVPRSVHCQSDRRSTLLSAPSNRSRPSPWRIGRTDQTLRLNSS